MRPNGNSREHWSASSLRELCSCPMRYRLHRIDGCRPSHRSPGLVLGSAYHEAVANALIALHQGKAVEADDLAKSFASAWAAEVKKKGPPIRWTDRTTAEKQKELGLRLVRAWYEQGLPLFADTEIVAVELPFTVPIVSSEGEVLERPLTGYIDAVVRTADVRTVVIDHKTASQNFSDAEIELDRERLVTDFLGDPCVAYARLSRDGKGPSLRRVLRTTARMRTSTRSDIPARLLSLSDPFVRERVEVIPA